MSGVLPELERLPARVRTFEIEGERQRRLRLTGDALQALAHINGALGIGARGRRRAPAGEDGG